MNTQIGKVIDDAVDSRQGGGSEFRTHLGGSVIGHDCARHVWYHFRWTALEHPPARMVRLWERGDREEKVFEDLLKEAGCEVYTADATTGEQFRIHAFGNEQMAHFGGSLDGIIKGVPELPNVWMLLEFKTHNEKSFKKLAKEGVQKSKPQHYGQMQVYMGHKGLTHALYCAVNKNDDTLYFEVVPFNQAVLDRYMMRADNAINSPDPLEKVSQSPAWFQCRFCEFAEVCHKGGTPYRNCRTCEFAEVDTEDGVWRCTKKRRKKGEKKKPMLSKQEQLDACKHYTINPAFKKKR